jgi:hypothetical protein
MPGSLQDLIRRGWVAFRFRRHWPWVLLVLGLPLALPPVDSGCAGFLAGCGCLVILFRGLRWIWDKILFRVSRRLWVILALMSVLPVLGLGVLLTATSWLGLARRPSAWRTRSPRMGGPSRCSSPMGQSGQSMSRAFRKGCQPPLWVWRWTSGRPVNLDRPETCSCERCGRRLPATGSCHCLSAPWVNAPGADPTAGSNSASPPGGS